MQQLDWRPYFPLRQPRPEQSNAIEYIIEQVLLGKEYIIAELGTGVGKSAIAMTIARWARAYEHELRDLDVIGVAPPTAYVLTSQKILQDQYARDFSGFAADIRSSANFECSWLPGQTCAETMRIKRALQGKECLKNLSCKNEGMCPYRAAKELFKGALVGVTNYSYFLSETVYVYNSSLKQREFLIMDEAHNIESEVRRWATISIDEKFVQKELGINMPKNLKSTREVLEWAKSDYASALAQLVGTTLGAIESGIATLDNRNAPRMRALTRRYELLDKHMCQVNRFIEGKGGNYNDYLATCDKNRDGYHTIQLKPINITWQSRAYLFSKGHHNIMMSASILDKKTFMRSAGIKKDTPVGYISMPSPFPYDNRPIFYAGVGKMTFKEINKTLPRLADAVRKVLNVHSAEKGIIHTKNYKIAEYLVKNINDPRLLTHTTANRNDILKRHLKSKTPTVLVSPSMNEGVDLSDNASRFQVLCKVPFPYMGDAVVKRKMIVDPSWYNWITAQMLIQSIGRSIRSVDDHAVTYILDTAWESFYKKNRRFFPSDFDKILHVV